MTNDAEIVIGIRGEVGGARVVKRSLDDVADSGDRATREAQRLERQMGSLNRAANMLKTAFAGLIGAMGVRELIRFSDGLTTMETQLRNVTRGTQDYSRKFNELFKIAQNTGDAFNGLVQNYVRLNTSLPDAIANTTNLTKVTELLSRGFAASGTSARAAGAVMTQLTQGLAGNFANAAQEINSLIEGAPLLAKTIAVELGGKAATDLKRFAEAGELTSVSFLAALQGAENAIKAYELPPTIERSWQRLKNAFTEVGSESDYLKEASKALAGALDTLAENVDLLIGGVAVLVGTALPALIGLVGTALPAAFKVLQTVMLANPLFLVASLISGSITALYVFREEIEKVAKQFDISFERVYETLAFMGDAIVGTYAGFKNVIFGFVNDIQVKLFEVVDSIYQLTGKGGDLLNKIASNIDASNIGKGIGERFNDGFNEATEDGFLAKEYMRGTSEVLEKGVIPAAEKYSSIIEKATGNTKEAESAQDELNNLIRETATAQEAYNMRVAELEKLRAFADTEEEIRAINRAIAAAGEELEEFRLQAELDSPLAKTFENIASEIGDGFKDAFKDAFTATEGGWNKLIEGFKSTFRNLLAELAYQALARPIITPIIAGVGGSMGLSSNALASMGFGNGGATGGGFSLGNIGNLASMGKSLFGSNAMLANGFNQIGSYLGFSPSGLSSGALSMGGFSGPGGLSSYSTLTNGSWGGTLGGAAGGFIGNFGANAIFGSDRGIGANIGGTIGAIAGSFIPIPVLGTAIGAFAGNAIGGLFGGNSVPSDYIMGITSVQDGRFANYKFNSDEASDERKSAYKQLQNTFIDQANAILDMIGGTLSSAPVVQFSSSGKRDGGKLRVAIQGIGEGIQSGQTPGLAFGSGEDAINYALANVFKGADISGISDTSRTILNNADGSMNLLAALQFGQQYDAFTAPTEEVSQIESALQALDAQFNGMKETASALGLSVGKLTDAYNKQKQALKDDFLNSIEDAILSIEDPAAASLAALERQFDALRKDADALGVSTERLEYLYKLRVDMIEAEEAGFRTLKDLADNLLDYLDGQKFSSTSSLTPFEKFTEAQDKFTELLLDAQGGDYGAVGKLTETADLLLTTARDVYASSTQFANIEQYVRDALQDLGSSLELPGFATGTFSAPSGLAWVGEQGPELVNFRGGERVYNAQESASMTSGNNAQGNAIMAEMLEELRDIKKENALLRKQMGQLSSKMAVRG